MDPKEKFTPDATSPDLEPIEPGPANSLVPLEDDEENTDTAKRPPPEEQGPAPGSTILFDDDEEDEVTPSRPRRKPKKPAAPPASKPSSPGPAAAAPKPKSSTRNVAVLQAVSGAGTHARKAYKPALKGDAFEGPAPTVESQPRARAQPSAAEAFLTPTNVVLITAAALVIAFVVWLLW